MAWGNNDANQTEVPSGLSNVVAIAAGDYHNVALKEDGTLVAWGEASLQTSMPPSVQNVTSIAAWDSVTAVMGRLTRPVITEQPVDQHVGRLQNVRLSVTAPGFGFLYKWYRGGRPVSAPSYEPYHTLLGTQTDPPVGGSYRVEIWNSAATAASEAASITVGPIPPGTVVGWNPRTSDTRGLQGIPAGLSNVVALAAGAEHVLALKDDGTVVSWGVANYGQVAIPKGLRDVVAIDAESYHSMALRGDGTVVDWGPVPPGPFPDNLRGVVEIAAGSAHSMALKRDGTVTAWGGGAAADVPDGLTGVVAIDAGYDLSIALTSEGSVVEWGLGGNRCNHKPRPADVTNVTAIAAAWGTTLVIKDNGRVEAWGDNCTGQASPPESLRDVVAISGGMDQSFALRADGTLASWGSWGLGYRPRNLGRTSAISVGGLVYELVGPVPAVRPRIISSDNGLELRWRSSGGPVTLQVTETMNSAEWQPYSFTGIQENGWIRVPWNADAAQQYFRLAQP